MKIIVTGANGQIGRELCRIKADRKEIIGLTRQQLDITDPIKVDTVFKQYEPDAVINAAAYTDVNKAEAEIEQVYKVNYDAVKKLASSCKKNGLKFIHISTDYVFSGEQNVAYKENDIVSPINVYGQSKAQAEESIRDICDEHFILRCSWLFSPHNSNFVKTIIKLASEREELSIVNDQIGCPTSASQVAKVILTILPRIDEHYGTYHYAQPEAVSWYEFALAVVESMHKCGFKVRVKDIKPITTKEYKTAATRPAYSVLDCSRLKTVFGIEPISWRISLNEVMEELYNGEV